MKRLRLPRRFPVEEVGAAGYQEFAAGAIPIRHALTLTGSEPLVLVEHRRGFQLAFDRHLDTVRKGIAPCRDVDYLATWSGMTSGPARPPLVRLDLAIDGLRPRVRLLFKGGTLPPLWLLADDADFGLLLAKTRRTAHAALTPTWVLGPTPVPDDLRRILRWVGAPRPPELSKTRAGRQRIPGRGRRRRAAAA